MTLELKGPSHDLGDAKADEEDSEASHIYLRTQMLLFLLCAELPAIRLAAVVATASRMAEDTFLPDLHIAHLADFVRNLSLELCNWEEREEERRARERAERTP